VGEHIQTLLDDYIMPLFSFTALEYDNFESNPTEYLQPAIDNKQQYGYKKVAADLLTLILVINDQNGEPVYLTSFLGEIVSQMEKDNGSDFRVKDGCMFVLQHIHELI